MMEKLSANEFDENYKVITENLNQALVCSGRIADSVTLLAATKTVDIDTINYAISRGIQYIGENKVQELLAKDDYISGVHKHFIGHLQTNKVKDIVDRVEMIESVDSYRLAAEISKQAGKIQKDMDILLEVNIGAEQSKSGFFKEELFEAAAKIANLPHLRIRGLMAIPPICENAENNRKFFVKMHELFIDIQAKKIDNSIIDILSMGMSDDYAVAVSEGATLVRVGTALFGKRIYNF